MTETPTTKGQERQSVPRCTVGSNGEHPCPRQATKTLWPGEAEPTLCDEHARTMELGAEVDDLLFALDQLGEWIQSVPKENNALLNAVYDQRDTLERRYLEAAVKLRGAKLIADGKVKAGRREYPAVSPEQAEDVAIALMRADAFNDARAVLEGLPDEAFGEHDRWVICAFLAAEHEAANAECQRVSSGVWPAGE